MRRIFFYGACILVPGSVVAALVFHAMVTISGIELA